MTLEERRRLLTDISEKTGDNEEVMNMLKQLEQDNDAGFQREDVYDGDEKWKDKYEKLRTIYRERFFNNGDDMERKEYEVKEETTEAGEVSFDSLFVDWKE